MATITLKGNAFETVGSLPEKGLEAEDFLLTANDLSSKNLEHYKGKNIILNIFPSIDTPTCAQSVRQFNNKASQLKNTVVLCISKDLPFAQSRFCGAEGIKNVETLSEYKNTDFSIKYGVLCKNGPLEGLMSRAIVVINPEGKIVYTEQVLEIGEEPNYKAAINSIT